MNIAQTTTTKHPIKPFNPWKKENWNKQDEIARSLNFGIYDKYKIGDQVLYLSFATTFKTKDDYNMYIISPGTIEKIIRSPIDGVIRYNIRGYDWPHPESSTKKYIKLNTPTEPTQTEPTQTTQTTQSALN